MILLLGTKSYSHSTKYRAGKLYHMFISALYPSCTNDIPTYHKPAAPGNMQLTGCLAGAGEAHNWCECVKHGNALYHLRKSMAELNATSVVYSAPAKGQFCSQVMERWAQITAVTASSGPQTILNLNSVQLPPIMAKHLSKT